MQPLNELSTRPDHDRLSVLSIHVAITKRQEWYMDPLLNEYGIPLRQPTNERRGLDKVVQDYVLPPFPAAPRRILAPLSTLDSPHVLE